MFLHVISLPLSLSSLSGNELHTLMVTVIELPLTKSSVARFATMIQLCSPSTNVSLTHSGQLYSLQVQLCLCVCPCTCIAPVLFLFYFAA